MVYNTYGSQEKWLQLEPHADRHITTLICVKTNEIDDALTQNRTNPDTIFCVILTLTLWYQRYTLASLNISSSLLHIGNTECKYIVYSDINIIAYAS